MSQQAYVPLTLHFTISWLDSYQPQEGSIVHHIADTSYDPLHAATMQDKLEESFQPVPRVPHKIPTFNWHLGVKHCITASWSDYL